MLQINEEDRVQLYRRNPKLFVPSDFDYSPYFEIIKYPFMDFSTHASYRLLPWSDSMQPKSDAPGPVDGADSVDASHG